MSSPSPAPPRKDERQLRFNGRPATPQDLEVLARLEASWGAPLPAGAYWYDNMTGAAGVFGGPTRAFLPPGLGLGGTQAPADASGGGDGRLSGVFINGRELHPLDVQGLTLLLGQPPAPGAWWVDALGNFGPQGYGSVGNLHQIAAARRGRGAGGSYYRSDITKGSSSFVGGGGVAITQRLRQDDPDSAYSYYYGLD